MTNPVPPVPAPVPIDPTAIASEIAQDVMSILEESPAWKTAPFWITVATMILGLLVALGIVRPNVAASANVQELVQLIAGIAAIVIPPVVYGIATVLHKHGLTAQKAVLQARIARIMVARLQGDVWRVR